MDLSTAIAEFVADLQLAGRTYRTVEGHQLELLRLERWLAEQTLDWQQLNRRQLNGYTRLRAGLGHSSRSNMLCSLRVFFRWAVAEEYIAMSPAASYETPRKPIPLPRALTLDQIRPLVAHLGAQEGRTARRDEALILTALYAGLRAAELAALPWSAVDFAGQLINIRISKGNRGRVVKLHQVLADKLPAWRELQALGDQVTVFSLDGQPINAQRPGKICRKVAAASGVDFTTHALRHSFATHALRRSGALYAVSKSLGHSQLKQTEVYIRADPSDSAPAVDSLPPLEEW